MADNSIVQTIKDAEIDARSLSEFLTESASFMVTRRLAPKVHTLDYYLNSFDLAAAKGDAVVNRADAIISDTQDRANNAINQITADGAAQIATAISNAGFIPVGSFSTGATLNNLNDVVQASDGKLYRWGGALPKTVPSGSTPESTGGFGSTAWLEVSDAALRQELSGSPADGLGAALISGTVIRVTSIEEMKTYSAPVGYVFSLNDNGRSGIFDVLEGDFSAELAADTYNGIYVPMSDDPTATEKVAKRRHGTGINVSWFGVTGSGNESNRIKSAANMGDTILFDQGSYIAEGLPIRTGLYYKALGDVTINLPETPSDHMFKTTGEDDVITSGGISGIKLSGGGTQVYNGLDFSSIFNKSLEYWVAEEVWITGFNRGYNGTNNDRMPVFRQCRFLNNLIGAYGGEHPLFVSCDFRGNDVGLTGRLNDFKCVDTKFAYNRIGMKAHDEFGGATSSRLSSCNFYRNTEIAVEIGTNSALVGCRIDGSGAGSHGVVLKTGLRNTVSNCLFNQTTLTSDTCIYFPERAEGILPRESVFSGNIFGSAEVAAISLDVGANLYSITGNTFSNCKSFIVSNSLLSNTAVQGNVGTTTEGAVVLASVQSVSITGNSFTAASATIPILNFAIVGATSGNIVSSNNFIRLGVGRGVVFGGSLARTSFTSNRLSNIDLGLSGITNMSDAYINGNSGLSTRQYLNLTVKATETTATASFALDFDIAAGNIKLIPLKNSSSLANAHVSSVDNEARTFTVTLQEPAGVNCLFAVEINRNYF